MPKNVSKKYELSFRAIVIAIFLTMILATANAFLALKLGMLTSASIPAAILSMGILRFFKDSSIWENNLIQTAASAGEAVAGGIVYTIPALVIIGFWNHFSYWQNFSIACISGLLGVVFSIPLRKTLVHHQSLPFPEGRAIAAILQNQSNHIGFQYLVLGLIFGGVIDFCQTGIHILAPQAQLWFDFRGYVFMLGMGFSIAMMSAGFLMGSKMSASICIGAMIAWFIVLPLYSHDIPHLNLDAAAFGGQLWSEKIRYFGIGALMFAAIVSLVLFIKPVIKKMVHVVSSNEPKPFKKNSNIEKDIPRRYLIVLVMILSIALWFLLNHLLPFDALNVLPFGEHHLVLTAVLFVLLIGFVCAVVSGYFSAMVGVSASPGSSIVISALLLASMLVLCFWHRLADAPQTEMIAAEAIVIILASLVTGIAAIANDNIQDLKVGQLIGATPWRQEVMLMLGVVISSLVIPAVMQILFQVYGIAGHGGTLETSLPAPTAALLAVFAKGFFQHALPWDMMLTGAFMMLGLAIFIHWFPAVKTIGLSLFGIAIGMYLPLETSTPLVIGGLLAWILQRKQQKGLISQPGMELAICFACGSVAGSAIMDVALSTFFAFKGNVDALSMVDAHTLPWSVLGSVILVCVLFQLIKSIKLK